MKTVPFWTDDFPGPAFPPPADLPRRLDVAVVGGGYTGLSAALTLARGGTAVAVFERGRIGGGASSVNGGQLCPGLKKTPRELFAKLGPSLGRELWQASVEAVRTVEELIEAEGIDCAYRADGSLSLAFRASHYERQVRAAEWMERELGHHKEPVGRGRLREEIGSDVFYGGLRDRLGGGLHPARYAFGLAAAAARAGALLVGGSEVTEVRRTAGGLTLRIGSREVAADEVLIATNGYTEGLVPRLRRQVFPIGSYMIATEPLPAGLREEISPRGRMFFDTRWFLNYFRLTPDGRLALGGRNDLSTDHPLDRSAVNLRASMLRIFPQLADVRITHTWTGRLGFTFDLLPRLGQQGRIRYAFGYSGHGVGLATYLGREAARLALGEIASSPFARVTSPVRFYYRRRPWFLPLAAAYYRALDRFT